MNADMRYHLNLLSCSLLILVNALVLYLILETRESLVSKFKLKTVDSKFWILDSRCIIQDSVNGKW